MKLIFQLRGKFTKACVSVTVRFRPEVISEDLRLMRTAEYRLRD